jgi:hypothetical protein
MTDKIFHLENLMTSELDRHYLEISYSDFRENLVFKEVEDEDFLYTFQLMVTTGKVSFIRFGPDKTRHPKDVRKIKRIFRQYNPKTHIIDNYSIVRPYEIDDGKELYILSEKRCGTLKQLRMGNLLDGR